MKEPTIDMSRVMPPKEKTRFASDDLERLFNLSGVESVSTWKQVDANLLTGLIGREVGATGKTEAEVKQMLIERISKVEHGLGALSLRESSISDDVNNARAHLRGLLLSLES